MMTSPMMKSYDTLNCKLVNSNIFVWDFPHFVSASNIYTFICVWEQSVCHVVSTWHVDWVPLARRRTLGFSVFVRRPLVWLLLLAVVFWWILTFFWDLEGVLGLSVWDTRCWIYFWRTIYYKVGKQSLSVCMPSTKFLDE